VIFGGQSDAWAEESRPLRIPGRARVDGEDAPPDWTPPRIQREGGGRWAQWLLSITGVLAAIPLVLCIAIAIGLRAGLIDWRTGLTDQTLDWPYRFALVGLVGGLVAIFAAMFAGFGRFWRRALFSLAGPMAVMGVLVWLSVIEQSFPPVHEVATDWSDPIRFSPALLAARGASANPVETDPVIPADGGRYMNRRVADVNADTCPQAHTVVLQLTPSQAFDRARQVLKQGGLSLVTDDPANGRIEATLANPWLGLLSDVAIRVRGQGQETRVDFRASSRQARSDFGANCGTVGRLVQTLQGG
jgi:fatty-acyl-CoA synthase